MSAGAETQFENDTAVVVFGLDDSGKAHASAFGPSEAESAEKAADLMGMRLLRLETDEQRSLAAKLPRGRVFAGSGKAFVPFVAKPLYEPLAAFGGSAVGDRPGGPQRACTASPGATSGMPGGEGGDMPGGEGGEGEAPGAADPATIGVGTVVLATTGLIDGWWEAVVLKIDEKGVMTLKWRDYTGDPVFRRRRSQVALLPPESVGL